MEKNQFKPGEVVMYIIGLILIATAISRFSGIDGVSFSDKINVTKFDPKRDLEGAGGPDLLALYSCVYDHRTFHLGVLKFEGTDDDLIYYCDSKMEKGAIPVEFNNTYGILEDKGSETEVELFKNHLMYIATFSPDLTQNQVESIMEQIKIRDFSVEKGLGKLFYPFLICFIISVIYYALKNKKTITNSNTES